MISLALLAIAVALIIGTLIPLLEHGSLTGSKAAAGSAVVKAKIVELLK